eukprot:CAMPEP_0113692148 /NCGR_PEP_ID=MMETSP0038_2-20120614/18902_1 /TAXON_ID=2898 /ORGANISM="Cryptomonas paramecium" /LENGTH=439 /DNA_ID=CAMNT_0000613985 /DNA_START=48 /DNA_END=1364 /DNA_ORIENTATION=+ /assembly_acc=CAM_ASM_000170
MENEPAQPADSDPTHSMSREHAAAFKRVLEKRKVIWSDYAAAYQAALECVNTKQSQEFAGKYIYKGIPHFCGEGDPPVSFGQVTHPPGSAWDDWCGKNRRKINERTEDQTPYFKTSLKSAVRLVLAALDRGVADILDAADPILDPTSPIYSFHRDANRAAYEDACELYRECIEIWREGGGPTKRLALLEKAPWRCLVSIVKSSFIERRPTGAEATDLLNRVASRIENAPAKELSDAGNCCHELIQLIRQENRISKSGTVRAHPSVQAASPQASEKLHAERKAFKQRLVTALREIALRGTKSKVWAQRRDALRFLEFVISRDPEFKAIQASGSAVATARKCRCSWLDEAGVLEDLFGERAHATILSETGPLLNLIELDERRLSVMLVAALLHVGCVRAEVHRVLLSHLRDLDGPHTLFLLDRILSLFSSPPAAAAAGSSS